jgi:hypothetical protein
MVPVTDVSAAQTTVTIPCGNTGGCHVNVGAYPRVAVVNNNRRGRTMSAVQTSVTEAVKQAREDGLVHLGTVSLVVKDGVVEIHADHNPDTEDWEAAEKVAREITGYESLRCDELSLDGVDIFTVLTPA